MLTAPSVFFFAIFSPHHLPRSLLLASAAAVCVLSIAPAVDTYLAWRVVQAGGAYKPVRTSSFSLWGV